MKNKFYFFIVVLAVVTAGFFLFKQNIGTVNIPGKEPVTENTGKVASLPGFDVPEGFAFSIFARDIAGARALELDPKGRLLVSQTGKGKITAVWDTDEDGEADEVKVLASELNKPHGMAMRCEGDVCFLYVAERDALYRYIYDLETPALRTKEKLMDISSSATDRHFTRSLLFLPLPAEDILLISVGSSCDVCHEKDGSDYGKIISYNIKTKVKEVYAKGLRNAVFMTLNPESGKVFATEMGRDNLGDDLPPDEINIIENTNNQPQNYGWPICYGQNIHDIEFDKNTYIRNPCMEPFETPPFIDLQAHSAPLGLAFIPEGSWPEEYRHSLLVAYHGSWNRSVPTGYKIIRIKMNARGEYMGTEDFITGWLTENGAKTGRPVDIKVLPGGAAYISDDNSGMIYRLSVNH